MGRTEQRHAGHLDDSDDAIARIVELLIKRADVGAVARGAAAELEAARGTLRAAKLRPKHERGPDVQAAMQRIREAGLQIRAHEKELPHADTMTSVIRIVLGGLKEVFGEPNATPPPREPRAAQTRATAPGKSTGDAERTTTPGKRPAARPRAPANDATTKRLGKTPAVRSTKRTLPMGGGHDED